MSLSRLLAIEIVACCLLGAKELSKTNFGLLTIDYVGTHFL